MKNIKKITISMLIAGAMIASVASCSTGNQTGSAFNSTSAATGTSQEADGAGAESTANLFFKGVWAASREGKVEKYFIFYDEANGRRENADGTGSTHFICEQDGLKVNFYFGTSEVATKAVFKEGDAEGTFYTLEDEPITYSFEYLPDADPDNFTIPKK